MPGLQEGSSAYCAEWLGPLGTGTQAEGSSSDSSEEGCLNSYSKGKLTLTIQKNFALFD